MSSLLNDDTIYKGKDDFKTNAPELIRLTNVAYPDSMSWNCGNCKHMKQKLYDKPGWGVCDWFNIHKPLFMLSDENTNMIVKLTNYCDSHRVK